MAEAFMKQPKKKHNFTDSELEVMVDQVARGKRVIWNTKLWNY